MAKERLQTHELNPRIVRPEAVQTVIADLKDDPGTYFLTLRDKRFGEETEFGEILHPEFQIFRIGVLGFEIPIALEDREKYGIKEKVLSTLGPDGATEEDVDLDLDESINTMRAFVGSVFFEEARIQKLPIPKINHKLIDPPPVKKRHIEYAVASKPGMFLYEWEELEKKWEKDNPEFYQETIKLKDQLREYYSKRMLSVYKKLPNEYLEKVAPEIRNEYDNYLMEYAIRTYALFTPCPPSLIEVKKIKSKEK